MCWSFYKNMQANFTVSTRKQQKGFKGPVSKERMLGLLCFKEAEVVNVALGSWGLILWRTQCNGKLIWI